MTEYIRGFVVLLVLLTVLMNMPPGTNYQKYIRFFVELIMTLALLSPILSLFCDSEEFLELVEYEAFVEELESVARDMEQIEYLHSDYHKGTYEEAIAMDIEHMMEGYEVEAEEISVTLSDAYEVEQIYLQVREKGTEKIEVERIALQVANTERMELISEQIKRELMTYYLIEEEQIEISY